MKDRFGSWRKSAAKRVATVMLLSMFVAATACGQLQMMEISETGTAAGPKAELSEASPSAELSADFESDADDVMSDDPYDGVFPPHAPLGRGVGAKPGRVVWAFEPEAVSWDGEGYWWIPSNFDEGLVLQMVNGSIAALSGEADAHAGWQALFASHNDGAGYRQGQKIAIKVNMNGSGVFDDDTSGETDMSYTNPVLLKALLLSLTEQAGVAASDITVYDVSRLFPDYLIAMCQEGSLQDVQFVDRNGAAADEQVPINWSQEFEGRTNYLPTCVTEATYLVNLANLKGHSYGVTLCAKNHFGSFLNGNVMRPPEGANLHQWLIGGETSAFNPLIDLMANRELGQKTVLYMLDALICAPSEGAGITPENSVWQQTPFTGGFTASILVSQDPVAIDSVGADFLSNEPTVQKYNPATSRSGAESYLHEAGLVLAAPSGTVYQDGQGSQVENLGVHEHWNNSREKQYSRNLGRDEGIELVRVSHEAESSQTDVRVQSDG